jgi:hypothetical protein
MTRRIPLTEAALRLGIDYQQCRRLLLSGRLAGGRDEFGRLFIASHALKRALRNNPKSSGSQRLSGKTDV